MKLWGRLAVCGGVALRLLAADAPPSPFIDKGACPFECCTYRRWQALKSVPVFDAPNDTRQIATLQRGEWVTALTGETHSIPVAIAAPADFPKSGIHKGDRIYVLHYLGEGSWKLWVRGRIVEEELLNLDNTKGPKTEWWAKVRTANGTIGWVRADDRFGNQDACG